MRAVLLEHNQLESLPPSLATASTNGSDTDGGGGAATLLTVPLSVAPGLSVLRINADTTHGSLRVAILDAAQRTTRTADRAADNRAAGVQSRGPVLRG